jgi:hypothetical protein
MAKKRASLATASPEVPKRDATCEHCGHIGQVGTELAPYAFAKNDRRWLCWAGTSRTCFVDAWRKFSEGQALAQAHSQAP